MASSAQKASSDMPTITTIALLFLLRRSNDARDGLETRDHPLSVAMRTFRGIEHLLQR